MMKIEYEVGDDTGAIYWAASEHFEELAGEEFKLGEMEAVEIVKRTDLSLVGRILLSAVAGAVIQHVIDLGMDVEKVFATGRFWIGDTE